MTEHTDHDEGQYGLTEGLCAFGCAAVLILLVMVLFLAIPVHWRIVLSALILGGAGLPALVWAMEKAEESIKENTTR